jgi:DNA-binding response OmpR family regulator
MNSMQLGIHGSRILVVDDPVGGVGPLVGMLRDAGYTNVDASPHAREARARQARNRYDLVLLDLQTPEVDGLAVFEALEGLKSICGDPDPPVVLVSAHPDQKFPALQAGAKDFVSKPFDFVEVKARVDNMLEVRLLYRRLEAYSEDLEREVRERTQALLTSEARYRRLIELASDWFWEQDEMGNLVQGSGPSAEFFNGHLTEPRNTGAAAAGGGWNPAQRESLRATIAARRPFLDLDLSRVTADGRCQKFVVSGEPMFDQFSRYIGYRGIGTEVRRNHPVEP